MPTSPRRFRIIFRADRAVRPYAPSTERPPCFFSVIPRARSARGNPFPFHVNQRPKAATYLCRFAAKARFDNRPNPRRVFPKREGRSPPSLVVSRMGDFQGGRKIETSFPLKWRSLVTFFRQGKKVTRRRQKEKGQKKEKSCTGGQRRPPLHTSTENPCAIYPGGCGHPPLRNHRQARASSIRRDEVIAPYEKGRR